MSHFKLIVVRRRKRRSFFEGLIHKAMGHSFHWFVFDHFHSI